MMNRVMIFLTTFFFTFPFFVKSQDWPVEWKKQLGNDKMDYFTDVVEDINGGYTILGSTFPDGGKSYDLWLIRFTEKGDLMWNITLGTEFKDIPKKIIQNADGEYLLLGMSEQTDSKILLIKTDKDGKELWRKNFEDEYFYLAEDIISDGENGLLIVGSKSADKEKLTRWFAKLDDSGKVEWERIYAGDLKGFCKAVKKMPDGGFVIVGQVEKPGLQFCDTWVTRLNKRGEPLWSSQIASADMKIWPECVCCSPDSFLIVVGWQGLCMNDINSENPIFDFDLSMTKIDKNGKIVWAKNIKREGSEGGNSVAVRSDGKFVVAGIKATSFLGKVGPWLLLLDSDGNEISEQVMRFHCQNDQAVKVINTKDGGVVAIGPGVQEESNTRCNGWILKFARL